jgi:hypothetical protein
MKSVVARAWRKRPAPRAPAVILSWLAGRALNELY